MCSSVCCRVVTVTVRAVLATGGVRACGRPSAPARRTAAARAPATTFATLLPRSQQVRERIYYETKLAETSYTQSLKPAAQL